MSVSNHLVKNLKNVQAIINNRLNKGLAFTNEERKQLGIRGLFPAQVLTIERQEQMVLANLKRLDKDLDKYVYLMHLLDRNEKLFYKVLSSNVEEIMPIVYTPTVGEACIKYDLIFNQPKGMFITINDKGSIFEVLSNWPTNDVKVIVVTDGERILGLGDLGVQGMGIPVGKLALYTALAGVNPSQCLPITLDVGTNNEHFLHNPSYIGLRQKRVVGQEYDEFLDEFVEAVKQKFGETCLIQFEDFANHNAFRLLTKYQNKTCTFNDDIQGTASMVLSGILTATRISKLNFTDNVFLFYGAGEAAIGTANLLTLAMVHKGLSEQEARDKIWLVDSKGLIVKDRPEGGINSEKILFAKAAKSIKNLSDIIDFVKPTSLIGCAAQGRIFTKEILNKMAKFNKNPIIFALSNPTIKSECTAEEAYTHTNGTAIFASGSPFDDVKFNGRVFHPGQGNNCYIFPAIGLATVSCSIRRIPNELFVITAQSLSKQVTQEELDEGRVYPNLKRIQDVSVDIAVDVATYAMSKNLCQLNPKPASLRDFIASKVYLTSYDKISEQ